MMYKNLISKVTAVILAIGSFGIAQNLIQNNSTLAMQQQLQVQLPKPQVQQQKQEIINFGSHKIGIKAFESLKKDAYYYKTGKKIPPNFNLERINAFENSFGSLIFTIDNELSPLNILTNDKWQYDNIIPYVENGRIAARNLNLLKQNSGISNDFTDAVQENYEENKNNETEDNIKKSTGKRLATRNLNRFFRERPGIKFHRLFNNRPDIYGSRKFEVTSGSNEFEMYKQLNQEGKELPEYDLEYDDAYL